MSRRLPRRYATAAFAAPPCAAGAGAAFRDGACPRAAAGAAPRAGTEPCLTDDGRTAGTASFWNGSATAISADWVDGRCTGGGGGGGKGGSAWSFTCRSWALLAATPCKRHSPGCAVVGYGGAVDRQRMARSGLPGRQVLPGMRQILPGLQRCGQCSVSLNPNLCPTDGPREKGVRVNFPITLCQLAQPVGKFTLTPFSRSRGLAAHFAHTLQSIRASVASSAAKNFCQPNLAPL